MSTGYDTEFETPVEKWQPKYDVDRPTSKLAKTSLVFGILGLTAIPLYGSIVAVATGYAALGVIRESEGRLSGKSQAKVGIGLGYLAIILALMALVVVYLSRSRSWADSPEAIEIPMPTPAEVQTPKSMPTPVLASLALPGSGEDGRGVKMVNQMVREDFKLIEGTEAGVKEGEIIAYYNAGKPKSNPEFALLTTDRLVYLNDGRKTAFDLKDVAGVKDDKSFEEAYNVVTGLGTKEFRADLEIYHIEVRNKQGIRMRIDIQPPQDGSLFFDALRSALPASGMTITPEPGS